VVSSFIVVGDSLPQLSWQFPTNHVLLHLLQLQVHTSTHRVAVNGRSAICSHSKVTVRLTSNYFTCSAVFGPLFRLSGWVRIVHLQFQYVSMSSRRQKAIDYGAIAFETKNKTLNFWTKSHKSQNRKHGWITGWLKKKSLLCLHLYQKISLIIGKAPVRKYRNSCVDRDLHLMFVFIY